MRNSLQRSVTLSVTLILLVTGFSSCSTIRTGTPTELKITNELLREEDRGARSVKNGLFEIEVQNSRRLEITNSSTAQKQLMELDWPLISIRLCPSCGFASLWYTASNGAPYNALLDLNQGEMIQQLGPSEYQWSEKGMFLAMGYPQKIEIIRSDLFESYLETASGEDKERFIHRTVTLNPASGSELNLVGFYEDWVFFFQMGCCGNEKTFGLDLEQSGVHFIPCSGSECKDLDDLGEIFNQVKNKPKVKVPDSLFKVTP